MNSIFTNFPLSSSLAILSIYTDDLLISSMTWSDHLRDVNAVLSRLYRYNCRLDISKSRFGCTEIEYLGQLMKDGTIKVSPERTASLDKVLCPDLAKPQAAVEKIFQRLLGLTGVYRKFVKNYSGHESFIRDQVKKAQESKDAQVISKCCPYLWFNRILENALFHITSKDCCAALK